MDNAIHSLSPSDIQSAFLRAVTSMQGAPERWEQRAEAGLTDDELQDALKYELGIAGGSSCRDSISVAYQGAGLKIWASRDYANSCLDEPVLQDRQTMAIARHVFSIANPDDRQMALF